MALAGAARALAEPPVAAPVASEHPLPTPEANLASAAAAAPTKNLKAARPSISAGVWVAIGVTGVAATAGAVLGVLAIEQQKDFDQMPNDETANLGERYALWADVSLAVALGAAITGIVLYMTDKRARQVASPGGSRRSAASSPSASMVTPGWAWRW